MSGEFVLNAVARGDVGKGASRRLRNDELVPAIVYGGTQQPRNVSVSHRELVKALENEAFFSHLITLKIDGGAEEVILKDLQRHPARPRILHADFQRVSRDRKIHVHIPLHFINQEKCHGVKNQGGIVQHNANEVHVTCLPQDLAAFIEVDLRNLHAGHSIHASELAFPPGVSPVLHGEDYVVVSIPARKGAGESDEAEGGAAAA